MCSQVCAYPKKMPSHWINIYTHWECLTRSKFIGDYKNPQFLYNDDNTQCIMNSQDVGVLEDFPLKEIESTDVSEQKPSHTSLPLSIDIHPTTNHNLNSDVSVSCSQR